jgi:hypothetical protein
MADYRTAYRRGWREESFVFIFIGSPSPSVKVSVMCLLVLVLGREGRTHLRRRPRASSSATAPVRLPASSSCTVSQERVYVASQAYPCCVVPMQR